MRPAFLEALEENSHALFWGRLPRLTQKAPEVVRDGILFGKLHSDHGKRRALALIDAHQKMGDYDVLDISGIELGEILLAETRDGRFYVRWGEWLLGR
jgi:hypothetical protein